MKLIVFVISWFCTTILVNLLLSLYIFYANKATLEFSEFNEILIKDTLLSVVIVSILYFMMRKQLKATFE